MVIAFLTYTRRGESEISQDVLMTPKFIAGLVMIVASYLYIYAITCASSQLTNVHLLSISYGVCIPFGKYVFGIFNLAFISTSGEQNWTSSQE